MRLVRFKIDDGSERVGLWEDELIVPLDQSDSRCRTLACLLEQEHLPELIDELKMPGRAVKREAAVLLAPIDAQEVWAAGVTYVRSQAARMEESEAAADCYDRVYRSARPELFFKATPHRISGPGQPVRVRYDSKWSVPEPEVTLVLNSRLQRVGFTIGNDMSARDIEGENPLYLPQAKVYSDCCALGPCITLSRAMPTHADIGVRMTIRRGNDVAYEGATSVARMARSFEELVGWLGRENSFPQGVFLLTGTGIVPPSDFSLRDGDEISIEVDGIGTLTNPVVQSDRPR